MRLSAATGSEPKRFCRARHDGSGLFIVLRRANRHWDLAIWDVRTERELRSVPLPIAASAGVEGMALTADESHIILGTGTPTSDIWLLENFQPPASLWARWFRR